VTDADSSSLLTFGDDYKYVVMPLAKAGA